MPTPICKVCFKHIYVNDFHSLLFKNINICKNCFNQFDPQLKSMKIAGYPAMIIYNYDQTIKDKLHQVKGCYDVELASIFLNRFLWFLKIKYYQYYLVPIPSWHEDDQKRGFNHVEAIFSPLNKPFLKLLAKNQPHKQSSLSFIDRQQIDDVLVLKNNQYLTNQQILIVDDVYTSGATMKHAIKLIESLKPKKMAILLLSKTKDKK